jgi:CRISPR-associated protein Csb2
MLALDVQLLDNRYDAATSDRAVPEWPPHPARAFCALVAGARDASDWDALRWLERQPPPDVIASRRATQLERSGYVVTNRREAKGASQFHPGRTNQLRTRAAVQPTSDRVRFEWTGSSAAEDVVVALDHLAARIPYLGRSTTPVLASISTQEHAPRDDLARYRPCDLTLAQSTLRVPYSGYVDELRAAYDENRPAWEISRPLGYRLEDVEPCDDPPAASPFAELIVLRLPGFRPDGRLIPRITAALREAVMARTADPLPAALHGHGLDDKPHIAFVGLPDAGLHKMARGQLVGLGVALPEIELAERRKVVRALLPRAEEPTWRLDVEGIGSFDVAAGHADNAPRAATAERWSAAARTWVTVTPMAFDRHPKKGDDPAALVARSCQLAGYPEPDAVEISRTPLTWGAVRLTPQDLPARLEDKMIRHVRLHFLKDVTGPVLIGAGRYLGVGLFSPERPR